MGLDSAPAGAHYSLCLAADHPDRVLGQVLISPTTPLSPFEVRLPYARRFDEELDEQEGWAKDNARHWRRDYGGFLEFFFSQAFCEPHSTKQIEDAIGWGRETTPETLSDTRRGRDPRRIRRCPGAVRPHPVSQPRHRLHPGRDRGPGRRGSARCRPRLLRPARHT